MLLTTLSLILRVRSVGRCVVFNLKVRQLTDGIGFILVIFNLIIFLDPSPQDDPTNDRYIYAYSS
jgi:hypothetical protein